jgi:hypothetical protein
MIVVVLVLVYPSEFPFFYRRGSVRQRRNHDVGDSVLQVVMPSLIGFYVLGNESGVAGIRRFEINKCNCLMLGIIRHYVWLEFYAVSTIESDIDADIANAWNSVDRLSYEPNRDRMAKIIACPDI